MSRSFDEYMDTYFRHDNLTNLENLVEVLGYGQDRFMRGRALEEFFNDNPGAITAVLEFIENHVESSDWEDLLAKYMEENADADSIA